MSKLPRVIVFIGPIGAGKSTAAQALKPLGYHRISFADPLKQMLMTLGLTHSQVYGDAKETISPLLCGKTPRWAMQSLGTEWGRQLIGSDLWVNAWKVRCSDHPLVVVDDLRFPNEWNTLNAMGSKFLRISRPNVGHERIEHESEAFTFPADATIANNGTIEMFKRDVMFTVQSLAP